MAHLDLSPTTAKVEGIAEPHQNTVADILRAVGLGLVSTAEADLMIGRIRALSARWHGGNTAGPDETVG
ncbi:hypothetical protein ACIA8G_13220 [Lentzea sp. NPDC051213]|uniref:hypothetical protein n=1 Tax=Lentzea sp. NPDC051213 TaxID=3364126 RepID=UPI0037AC7C11